METGKVTLFARHADPSSVKLVHDPDGDPTVLASEVETADSFLAHLRGLMFRRSIPDDYALAFRFDEVGSRDVHMLFVPFPIDVLWVIDGEVTNTEQLSPWTGLAEADADLLVELPAGAADAVSIGDTVRLTE